MYSIPTHKLISQYHHYMTRLCGHVIYEWEFGVTVGTKLRLEILHAEASMFTFKNPHI